MKPPFQTTRNTHCWHKAKDPRCEGFPIAMPTYSARLVLFGPLGDEDEMTHDAAKTTVERKVALVCCRCNAVANVSKLVRFLWWRRWVRDSVPPCKTITSKAVESLLKKEAE